MRKDIFKRVSKLISFLILDFNRPEELKALLYSLKHHVKFDDYEVILLSNGGQQDYVFDLYEEGLIDKCILSRVNEGSGFGTLRLTDFCQSEYFINIQCDHQFARDLSSHEVGEMIKTLDHPKVGFIDFSFITRRQNKFSERAFMMKTDFYNSNPLQEGGGTGPSQNLTLKGTEDATGEWITKNNLLGVDWQPRLLFDIGKYAVIETPCGGVLRRRCDSQELEVIKLPKEKMPLWNLLDKEWDDILEGKWERWRIPEKSIEWIFFLFDDSFENEELNSKYKEVGVKNGTKLKRPDDKV